MSLVIGLLAALGALNAMAALGMLIVVSVDSGGVSVDCAVGVLACVVMRFCAFCCAALGAGMICAGGTVACVFMLFCAFCCGVVGRMFGVLICCAVSRSNGCAVKLEIAAGNCGIFASCGAVISVSDVCVIGGAAKFIGALSVVCTEGISVCVIGAVVVWLGAGKVVFCRVGGGNGACGSSKGMMGVSAGMGVM